MPLVRNYPRSTLAPTLLAVVGCFWWADTHAPLAQSATQSSASSPRQKCAALQGANIPRDAIGLPTNGAVVVSASLLTATDAGNRNGEFCKVLGAIHPVDPTAPPITFEVNLPTNWNNRLLQMGRGGYDGTLVTGLGGASNQVASAPTPLALGYATVGSDSGHEGAGGFDGTFALNDEALANFGHLQVKKTHDAAMHLVTTRYGSLPQHSYFAGGSQGGHEGLVAAVYAACDGLDGVEDGIISFTCVSH